MKKYSNEFKVGLFIVLCILGLFYLLLSTGKLNLKREGYHIYVVFDEAAGLAKKAPVMLNGFEIGKVDDIKISYDNDKTQVVLKLWLNNEAKIRENATVSIKTLGLMGEKYIQISSLNGENFIKPEATLTGKPYMDLDALMEQAQNIAKDTVAKVNGLADEVKKLAENLNYTVEDNKDRISQIIENLEATSRNFEEFSDDIKRNPWKILFKTKEKKTK
jgi:phospholipid/cholesterol/gamma-HCH transport system substrate-binding protein